MDTFKTKSQKALDAEIVRLTEMLGSLDIEDENYAKITEQIKKLCEAREKNDPSAISMETVLTLGANLVMILVVLNFEKTGVITSKAFGWIGRK